MADYSVCPVTPSSMFDGSDSLYSSSRDSSPHANGLVSPAPSSPAASIKAEDKLDDKKPPAKKRKSWGQQLPTPTTSLPPR